MNLTELMGRIDALKADIDRLRPLDSEREQRIMQKFRLDWNYHSSNIEGNSLTYGETKTFILHGLTAEGKPLKDHLEIKGHNEVLLAIEEFTRGEHPLTEHAIKSLHQVILGKEPYQIPAQTPEGLPTHRWVTPGRYKTAPNHVRTATGETFFFSSPEETPFHMEELMRWYDKEIEIRDLPPLILAATFHYRFIRIHPFDDGNGRVARILMNIILMMHGYPPAIIRTEDKENYYRALRQADGGEIEPFIEYVGMQLLRSMEIYQREAMGEEIEEEDDIDKQIAMFKARVKMSEPDIRSMRSPDNANRIVSLSIIPIIEAILVSLKSFDDLFLTKESNLSLDTGQRFSPVEEALQIARMVGWGSVRVADLVIAWKDFVGGESKPFDYRVSIRISFSDMEYQVYSPDWDIIALRKNYDQILTRDEVSFFTRKIREKILEELEQRTKL